MKKGKKLQIEQLDAKLKEYRGFPKTPQKGWIHATRSALNMTMLQLGNLLKMAPSNVLDMERREKDGSITLKTLARAAEALNMRLVYGFLPADGTFQKMIEKQALNTARKIIMRTNATMKLEDQEVSKERLDKAIRELAEEIREEMPRYLWD